MTVDMGFQTFLKSSVTAPTWRSAA